MLKISATASELPTLLDQVPGVEWLSLDCFDTLVWRATHAPMDVFADLRFEGGAIEPRKWAERQARLEAHSVEQRGEIVIADIYRKLLPLATDAERTQAAAHELELEARQAYGFAPVRDLMLEAKRRGLKIAIVSDMYMSEAQLRSHIGNACGPETLALIDRVFVSSEYGTGKAKDLFINILADLGVSPAKILHVGDNLTADQERPSEFGINTVHFEQFPDDVAQRLRLEATAATLVGRGGTRVERPIYQLHRAQLALRTETDPAYCIGHDVMGPVMHGFASWLKTEAEDMEARTGKPVKLLFLMRDGYLPMRAFNALHPELADRVLPTEISRFTAFGTSFTDVEAIANYVMPGLSPENLPRYCKQMAMTPDEKRVLCRMDPQSFLQAVTGPYAERIIARSRAFADRMAGYLTGLGIQHGDAVMLCDIGYQGTVQNVVEPVLRDLLGLEVAGRYMALRQIVPIGNDKRGYLDTRNYDMDLLTTCWEPIGLIEELLNLPQGSVVDYTADGQPIREASGRKHAQSVRRETVQRGCVDYVEGARDGLGLLRRPDTDDADARRDTAVAALVRFLFLPQKAEVEVIDSFDYELNQGTGNTLRLVDLDMATKDLRRRGLFYSRDRSRLFLPGELQQHGTHLNLSLLVSRRFRLDLRKSDFDVGGIQLPVMLINDKGHSLTTVDAFPTVDGYYVAQVPVGDGEYIAGLQFGQRWDWVQIEDLTFHRVEDLAFNKLNGPTGFTAEPYPDGMTQMGPGLFRCDPAGFILAMPPANHLGSLALSVVFRPISERSNAAVAANDQEQAA